MNYNISDEVENMPLISEEMDEKYNTSPKEKTIEPRQKDIFEINEEITEHFTFPETEITLPKDVVINEEWQNREMIKARILSYTDEYVICECLIDDDKKVYEKRDFPRMYFDHLRTIEKNKLIIIKINEKPGSMRIDIIDNTGLDIVKPKDFDVSHAWGELKNEEFDGAGF